MKNCQEFNACCDCKMNCKLAGKRWQVIPKREEINQ
jgi:hypothetical protein